MKILPALFAFLAASAVGQSISPPTQADLAPSTQEVTVDEARPIADISARGFGKFKDIFDKVKKKGGHKGKKPKDKKPKEKKPEDNKPKDNKPKEKKPEDNKPKDNKPKDEIEKKKGEDKKKDEKEQTESKTLSKKKFKFRGPKKGKGKGKGGGGGGDVESMGATSPKAPLLFIGGLFILTAPLMIH
ncbi:hypothetical protein EMPG_11452 [Blastomyces silverae]|uniref:Uncharacterized protein n=1 Tax=Blastomyces silverae TaxID=2060906 RepID=A0A0H1BX18_9EURO|nr:hypothetical protein EMPG_11452 [Blastomyces silverae]